MPDQENTLKDSLILSPPDNGRLLHLCGELDINLEYIEQWLDVRIQRRDHQCHITGLADQVSLAKALLCLMWEEAQLGLIDQSTLFQLLQQLKTKRMNHTPVKLPIRKHPVSGRTQNQSDYLKRIAQFDINFGIGPAGTGKTYLAVAAAVHALEQDTIERILLVRPAVEAGEHLGFLPGDLSQKVDPYLRPLYDALYEFMGTETVAKLIEQQVIEVAPLAYMRGRTLNRACVILDEAQNTTQAQMKMFLTRMGFGTKMIVTGDVTQIDLPSRTPSGLNHARLVLEDVAGIGFTYFGGEDIVRHPLVQAIVQAYEKSESDDE